MEHFLFEGCYHYQKHDVGSCLILYNLIFGGIFSAKYEFLIKRAHSELSDRSLHFQNENETIGVNRMFVILIWLLSL